MARRCLPPASSGVVSATEVAAYVYCPEQMGIEVLLVSALLIYLNLIGAIDVMPQLFGRVYVPGVVLQEIKDWRNPHLELVRRKAITGVTELDDCPEEA